VLPRCYFQNIPFNPVGAQIPDKHLCKIFFRPCFVVVAQKYAPFRLGGGLHNDTLLATVRGDVQNRGTNYTAAASGGAAPNEINPPPCTDRFATYQKTQDPPQLAGSYVLTNVPRRVVSRVIYHVVHYTLHIVHHVLYQPINPPSDSPISESL